MPVLALLQEEYIFMLESEAVHSQHLPCFIQDAAMLKNFQACCFLGDDWIIKLTVREQRWLHIHTEILNKYNFKTTSMRRLITKRDGARIELYKP